jgi:hypothetical protein
MLFYPVIPTIAVPASRATRQCTRETSWFVYQQSISLFPLSFNTSDVHDNALQRRREGYYARNLNISLAPFLCGCFHQHVPSWSCTTGIFRAPRFHRCLRHTKNVLPTPYPLHTQVKRKNNSTCRASAPEPYDHSSVSQRHLSSQIRLLEFLLFFYITRALLYPPRALPRSHRK